MSAVLAAPGGMTTVENLEVDADRPRFEVPDGAGTLHARAARHAPDRVVKTRKEALPCASG